MTHKLFPGLQALGGWAEDVGENAGPAGAWTNHLDLLEGDQCFVPSRAVQESIAVLHEQIRQLTDGSPANVDRIVRSLVDLSLTVVRHGAYDHTAAVDALFENLMLLER